MLRMMSHPRKLNKKELVWEKKKKKSYCYYVFVIGLLDECLGLETRADRSLQTPDESDPNWGLSCCFCFVSILGETTANL